MLNKFRVSRIVLVTVIVFLIFFGGCILAPSLDPAIVSSYQKKMVERSPIPRVGTDREVGFLRPARGVTGPQLEVQTVEGDGEGSQPRNIIHLSLEHAVIRTLANSSAVQVISYDPAISHEDVVRAAAQFDWVVFGGFNYQSNDRQVTQPGQIGQSDDRTFQAGVEKKTISGAQVQLAWSYERTWDDFYNVTDYEPVVNLRISQPLLRDAWATVNLAQLRVASLSEKISQQEFRRQVEDIVARVYSTYWSLIQARTDVEIQERLLEKALETYNRVLERYKAGLDATKVQTKQTESAVASRRAILIRSRKRIYDVQEQLGSLMGDAQINVLGEYEIVPTTQLVDAKVHINAVDQLVSALENNPVLKQGRLSIEALGINVRVAENQALPRLDLTGGVSMQSKNRHSDDAMDEFWDGDYVSYSIGIEFQYPVGNREREAFLRQAKLKERQAVANLQNLADQVAQAVNERVREIGIAYEELQEQRIAVDAAQMQLQALEDTEEIRGRLTPEFLNVKLTAQETLAIAETNELAAMVNYNTAMTDLHRITGTILNMPGVKIALPDAKGSTEWPAWVSEPVQPVGMQEKR